MESILDTNSFFISPLQFFLSSNFIYFFTFLLTLLTFLLKLNKYATLPNSSFFIILVFLHYNRFLLDL
jgi:hypothetical protein